MQTLQLRQLKLERRYIRKKKDDIGTMLKESLLCHEQRAQERIILRKKMEELKPAPNSYHFFYVNVRNSKKKCHQHLNIS